MYHCQICESISQQELDKLKLEKKKVYEKETKKIF